MNTESLIPDETPVTASTAAIPAEDVPSAEAPHTASDAHTALTCFHCGLPVPVVPVHRLPVLGRPRVFCCPGCVAVAQLIVSSGHETYYEYRQQQERGGQVQDEPWREWADQPPGVNAPETAGGADQTNAGVTDYQAYDDVAFQSRFVQSLPENQREAHLLLEGIRCAACVWLNERFLSEHTGVTDVSVDYASGQMRIRWDADKTRLSTLLQAVESLGYRAFPFDASRRQALNQEAQHKGLSQLVFAVILSMEVMAHAIATYTVGGPDASGHLPLWERIGRWTDLVVVTALLFYVGADFYRSAWRDLKNHHLGMDVPIVLGLSVAYVASVVATWQSRGHVYFDSIAMFLTLMMAARYFELKARLKAAASFDRLMKLVPATVRRLIPARSPGREQAGDQEENVSVNQIQRGDRVRVLAGEQVAVDGVLETAGGLFNESHLTGEAMPVKKAMAIRSPPAAWWWISRWKFEWLTQPGHRRFRDWWNWPAAGRRTSRHWRNWPMGLRAGLCRWSLCWPWALTCGGTPTTRSWPCPWPSPC